MQDCKVDILGTEYSVKFVETKQDGFLDDADGYCDSTAKLIVIRKDNPNELKDLEHAQNRWLRHELIHAFLLESGIGNNFEYANKYGHNETLADWFAIQSPKIFTLFSRLGIM